MMNPRKHQDEALRAIEAEWQKESRATVVMACGTGKTLVGLWAAEGQGAEVVLVLVPTISLLRQTLGVWLSSASAIDARRFQCVCSDMTVDEEAWEDDIRAQDVGYPVTTDAASIAEFLRDEHGGRRRRVVFSTYHSAEVVGRAARLVDGFRFDVAIFDEAHKTASEKGGVFGLALSDDGVPIKRRLFMTATPKHYKLGRRDRDGDYAAVSMSDESVYGKTVYKLSFAEAVRLKIILPFRIIVSVVDGAMVDNALLEAGQVVVNDGRVSAKLVAQNLALKHAVEAHGLRRVLTFHSRVERAKAFASDGSKGVGQHLAGFSMFHVSGVQSAAQRAANLKGFADAEAALISNARCLTEGVDVPSVDLVAFMEPRKGRVDVAQAAGRAMRKHKGKGFGYIMVPLFMERQSGESVDEAIVRSGFEDVVDVLNAMREADDELDDMLREASVDRGRGVKNPGAVLMDRIEVLGPVLHLNQIKQAISTRLVDVLRSAWYERFGELLEFREKRGHCNVPTMLPLGRWVATQRTVYRMGSMPQQRVERLESIGFKWNTHDAYWDARFEEARLYHKANGHTRVPDRDGELAQLRTWLHNQRQHLRNESLSEDKKGRLLSIGVEESINDAAWEGWFQELCRHQKEHPGSFGFKGIGAHLGGWCMIQRQARKEGRLGEDRIRRLAEIGFVWDLKGDLFERRLGQLREFHIVHGNCDVPLRYEGQPGLGQWVQAQRALQKEGRLQEDLKARLDALGFKWSIKEESWAEMFRALQEFKKENGHRDVGATGKVDPVLRQWCNAQRSMYVKGKLSEERKRLLEGMGFLFRANEEKWVAFFNELKKFVEVNGRASIGTLDVEEGRATKELLQWLQNQRHRRKLGKLAKQREAAIDQIGGFVERDPWIAQFERLKRYNEVHGDSRVRKTDKEFPGLSSWCIEQRALQKCGRLSADRLALLEEIGFCWARSKKTSDQGNM